MKHWKKNWPIYALFALFFLFLLIQQHYVFLYHDDYGYLALTYIPNSIHYEGSYGIWEIFQFLGEHYQIWGGRVVGLFYALFFCHFGLHIYHFVLSLAIVGIFVFIYLIATKFTNQRNSTIAWFTICCYGLFEIMQLRSGIYWMSASCLYVIPSFFFFAFVFMYQRREEKFSSFSIKRVFYDILMSIFIFLSTFSQEQIAVATVGFLFCYFIYHIWKEKKVNRLDVLLLIVSLFAFGVLMLAPGNVARMGHSTSAEFYTLSLMGKLKQNVPAIFMGLFGGEYRYFAGFFFLVFCYVTYQNLKDSVGNKYLNRFSFCLSVLMLGAQLVLPRSYFGQLDYLFLKHRFLFLLLLLIHFGFMIFSFLLYFIRKKEWNMIPLMVSAVLSQGVMLVAPYYAGRCAILFDLICFVFFACILCHFKKETKFSLVSLVIPFSLLCMLNMGTILVGYYENYAVNLENDRILRNASNEIKTGKDISKIYLKELPNLLYSAEQPYTAGNDSICEWIRDYYHIPQEVQLYYQP